jgi:hypothetical protein
MAGALALIALFLLSWLAVSAFPSLLQAVPLFWLVVFFVWLYSGSTARWANMHTLGLSAREQGIYQALISFSEHYFFLLPEIPSERLAVARKACCVPADELVLGLLDLTAEETAEHSLVFGDKGVYYHNPKKSEFPGPGAVRYAEFASRTFVNHGTQVYLGKDQFLCPEADWCENYPDGCDKIIHLLNTVRV